MSKMSELDLILKDLFSATEAINSAYVSLKKMYQDESDQPEEETPAEDPPVREETKLTLEDVRPVLAGKSKGGHAAEVRELLQKYGASKLSDVDPKNYEDLLKDAEAIEDAS